MSRGPHPGTIGVALRRPGDRLIVALDASTAAAALRLARRLRGLVGMLKIGSALFTACGPSIIRRVRALGFAVMLDLKFHDIPSTVEASCRAAVRHRVASLTVHGCGQPAMLEAAVRGARGEARRLGVKPPRVWAVTVLTSVEPGRRRRVSREVRRRARAAMQAGCDGVVASAHEAPALRRRFGPRLDVVCPGIRPAGAPADDQARVVGPAQALRMGADRLVVGRPITAARNPRAAAQAIMCEMREMTRC
jgi:orotidine-5'-phosphate decarboxylase